MSSQQITQSSTLPPAQPTYILRGHTAQIHAVKFFRSNLRLLTGDADGWIVLWDMPIKRPVAVWKAHNATILGVGTWDEVKIITHGRDGKLKVWQVRPEDETDLSIVLPIDSGDATVERKLPWLLHSLDVNTLNFCSFSMCSWCQTSPHSTDTHGGSNRIIVATPGVHDGTVVLTTLPDEDRHSLIPVPRGTSVGMVMAIALVPSTNISDECEGNKTTSPIMLVGYESGHATLWKLNSSNRWETSYIHKAHTQPILSIAARRDAKCWFSSSADAIIAQHDLIGDKAGEDTMQTVQTRHAGQQGLSVRSDDKIFATAGWDGRVRVYAVKGMRELAVLKWHREGCYALAFADMIDHNSSGSTIRDDGGREVTKTSRTTIAQQRVQKTKETHWLAAGSKDGKVSLWDIY